MKDKNIEQELKNSADKITMKSFSKRWENIKGRILTEEDTQEVFAEDAILATPEGTITRNVNKKSKYSLIAILSLIVSCIVVLTIVLPIMLRKNEMEFFDPNELSHPIVSQEQFYNEIKNSRYDIIDLSKYDTNSYAIFTTNEGIVKGGEVEIANEEEGYYLNIAFYDRTVNIIEPVLDYEKYNVKNVEIFYHIQIEDEIYSTYAYVEYDKLHYQIDYVSIYDDCISIFQELFS